MRCDVDVSYINAAIRAHIEADAYRRTLERMCRATSVDEVHVLARSVLDRWERG